MKDFRKFPFFPILILTLSCGYRLRGVDHPEKFRGNVRLQVINKTPEPELENLVMKGFVKVFQRGGFCIKEEATASVTLHLTSYSSSPSHFFISGKPAYRAHLVIKAIFEMGEKRKEENFSYQEDYLKSGILSFDERNEEAAKIFLSEFLAEEIYESFLNFINETF